MGRGYDRARREPVTGKVRSRPAFDDGVWAGPPPPAAGAGGPFVTAVDLEAYVTWRKRFFVGLAVVNALIVTVVSVRLWQNHAATVARIIALEARVDALEKASAAKIQTTQAGDWLLSWWR